MNCFPCLGVERERKRKGRLAENNQKVHTVSQAHFTCHTVTVGLLYNEPGTQSDWDTMGLVHMQLELRHNGLGTHGMGWVHMELGHNELVHMELGHNGPGVHGTGTQWDWYTWNWDTMGRVYMELGHNELVHMELGHNGPGVHGTGTQ